MKSVIKFYYLKVKNIFTLHLKKISIVIVIAVSYMAFLSFQDYYFWLDFYDDLTVIETNKKPDEVVYVSTRDGLTAPKFRGIVYYFRFSLKFGDDHLNYDVRVYGRPNNLTDKLDSRIKKEASSLLATEFVIFTRDGSFDLETREVFYENQPNFINSMEMAALDTLFWIVLLMIIFAFSYLLSLLERLIVVFRNRTDPSKH
jgi:hypothetical protein